MAKRKSKESPQPIRFVTFVRDRPVAFEDDGDYELRVDPIPPVNQYPHDAWQNIVYIEGEVSEDLNVGDMVILELTDTQVYGWSRSAQPPTYWRIVKDE